MDLLWDDVELLPKEMGADGLDGQHIVYGWLVLCYMASDEIEGIRMLNRALVCPLAADYPADNESVSHKLLCKLLKKRMAGKDKRSFSAHWQLLAIGHCWWWISLWVRSGTVIPCVAQMIANNLPEKIRKLCQWQKDCWASCNHWTASVKGCCTPQLCIGRITNQDSTGAATYVANIFWHMLNRR